MVGACKQEGCLKENHKRNNTSTQNQEKQQTFLGRKMRKVGLQNLTLTWQF